MIPRPAAAAAASPGHLLEMPATLPHSRQIELETRVGGGGVEGAAICVLTG